MACVERLARFLDRNWIPFQVFPHRESFTSEGSARASHVPRRLFTKAVVLRYEPARYLMAVLPATEHVDLERLRRLTRMPALEFANESELAALFPDCELGALPPFGHLWGLPMILDSSFEEDDVVYFAAGNHHETAEMSFTDYRKIAGPFAYEGQLHGERLRSHEPSVIVPRCVCSLSVSDGLEI